MTTAITREQLHQMLSEVPDDELWRVDLFIRYLCSGDPMLLAHAGAPYDGEPTTPEEDEGAAEAWQEHLHGKGISAEDAKRMLLP